MATKKSVDKSDQSSSGNTPDDDPLAAVKRASERLKSQPTHAMDHLDVPPPAPPEEQRKNLPRRPPSAMPSSIALEEAHKEDQPQELSQEDSDAVHKDVPAPPTRKEEPVKSKKASTDTEKSSKKTTKAKKSKTAKSSSKKGTPLHDVHPSLKSLHGVPKKKLDTLEKKKHAKVEEILKLDNWIEEKILKNWSDKKITEELVKQGFAKDLIELCHRRVLRKLQDDKPEEANLQKNITGLVSSIRKTFNKEQSIGREIVQPSSEKNTAENIAKLDNWIEDKIRKKWDDHKIISELLKQGWAHDIIRDSQLRISRKLSGKPKFGESDQAEQGGLGQFIKTIRKTFQKEENISEKLIDDINEEEEKREQEQEALDDKADKVKDQIEQSKQRDKKQDTEILSVKTSLERLDAQITALGEFRKVVNERFMRVAEDTGNLRGNIVNVEKDITEITGRVSKAIDLVEAVQPQQLFTELKKTDAKLEAQKAKLEGTKEISDKIMKELKEVRAKLGVVRGVEQIMKVHDEVKDTFAQVEQMKVLSERHADKVENLFIEMKKRLSSISTFDQTARNLQGTTTEVLNEMQKLKSREMQYITKDQLDGAQKEMLESSQVTTETVNQLKTQVAALQTGEQLKQLRTETEEAQEVLLQSVNQVKEEMAQMQHTVHDQSKKQLDSMTFRIEEMEEKVREHQQGGPSLAPIMDAIKELKQGQMGAAPSQTAQAPAQVYTVPSQPAPVMQAPPPMPAPQVAPPPVQMSMQPEEPVPQPQRMASAVQDDRAMKAMQDYNHELKQENHQFMKNLMDIAKREFSLIKEEMDELRKDHRGVKRASEIPQIHIYLDKLHPHSPRHEIVSSFVNLGWPRHVVEEQLSLFERKNGRRFH